MESKYDLATKFGICLRMGIDYLSSYESINIEQKKQQENIYEILDKILANPKLLKILDEIDDEFWDEAVKTGIIMYEEMAKTPNAEKEYLIFNKRNLKDKKLQTIDGKKIDITEKKVPVLTYQIKKNIINI